MEPVIVLEPLTRGVGWDALRLPGSSRQAIAALAVAPRAGTLALFHGPGPTGRARAAEALAGHLGCTAFRIDLGAVVSKYIGETEKALDAVFAAAATTRGLLLLDEADALIGPRTVVRDAHDRYANEEIACLLRRVEAFGGLTILGSRAVRDVAPALVRRCAAVVGIPRTP
jgi:SpoVK/Ycf46/Vps4 family AAA+-type ATPase